MKTDSRTKTPDKSRDREQTLALADAEILRAVHEVKYGSVEIVIHDARVVQVERREKVRFPSPES